MGITLKICMIVEGCYPYVVGGVSSWVQSMLQGFPQHEFIILAIITNREASGKFAYTIPDNVIEVRELYLQDADWLGKKRKNKLHLKKEELEALRSLVLGEDVQWRELFQSFQSGKKSINRLLMSSQFLDLAKELYEKKYSNVLFSDFLWTLRSMYLPLFYVLNFDIPKADIYHSVATGYAGILASMGKLRYGGASLISEHGIYTREREEELIKAKWVKGVYKDIWIEQFNKMSLCAYQNADLVTSLFVHARELQIELGCPKEKAVVVPNGVNIHMFDQVKGRAEEDTRINVGAILRVTPIKDLKTMLQAFTYAREREERLKLWIMGPMDEDPQYSSECVLMAQNLGLEDVEFTGRIQVKDYIGRMDMLLLTSISEGQPLTILEGFCAKKPSIATNVGNCSGLILGERDDFGAAGIITPVMSVEKIGEAILKLARDETLCKTMGETGWRRCREFYRKEQMMEAYGKIYQKLDLGTKNTSEKGENHMAGIGFQLQKIFRKRSILSAIEGIGYSSMISIGPMLLIIGTLLLIFNIVDYTSLPYNQRDLMAATILYAFIFSLLFTSPFNSVLSRYVADKIFEEKFEDILPCFYTGLVLNMLVVTGAAVPFYLWEIFVGGVAPVFVFGSYCMYLSLAIIFYTMLYLSATKDYKIISLYFLTGMVFAVCFVAILVFLLKLPIPGSVIYGMAGGFLITAALEFSYLKKYFYAASNNYSGVFFYFKRFYKIFLSNLFYTLGLFIHNFVFWFSELKHVTAKTYVSALPYDMASCLAMFTNISVTVIFIVQIETNFSNYYREYMESVIGGTSKLIEKAKHRMFRMLGQQIINIVQIQFIISMVIFLLAVIFLPRMGMSGKTMIIYPTLAAAYFIIFIMYCNVIFLYYFDDEDGALMTTLIFCAGVLCGSLFSRWLPAQWYGLGAFFGALLGWFAGYLRLMWMEKHLDVHIFCRGTVIPEKYEEYPDSVAYDKDRKKVLENIAPDVLVSIVIPVYNRSMELYYCVESIEKQTYRHFEVLILDSGSTDHTRTTCRKLSERYANVRAFYLEKNEIGVVRNEGLKQARGQYIMFVDADDELCGEKALFHLIVKAVKTDSDIIFGNYRKRIGEEEYTVSPHGFTEKIDMHTVAARFQGFFSPRHLSYVWGKLYKTSFLTENQLVFPKASYAEDKFFNITCYEYGAAYAWIEDEVYIYVQNEKAVTSKYKAEMKEIWFRFLDELEGLLEKLGSKDKDLELLTAVFAIALNAREEYNHKNKKLSAVKAVIRLYRKERRMDKNIRQCLFSKQVRKLPELRWRFLVRGFSLAYCLHLNLLLAMGIRFLSDFGLDQALTGESMKWEDKSLDEWEAI